MCSNQFQPKTPQPRTEPLNGAMTLYLVRELRINPACWRFLSPSIIEFVDLVPSSLYQFLRGKADSNCCVMKWGSKTSNIKFSTFSPITIKHKNYTILTNRVVKNDSE